MEELVNYWFNNPQIWFGCGPEVDEYITEKYLYLFEHSELTTTATALQKIILYDQIARHIYRNQKDKINYHHTMALKIAENITDYSGYSPEERCFLLLPMRHTFELNYLERTLELLKEFRKESDAPIYRRFYRATIQAIGRIKNGFDTIYKPNPREFYQKILDPRSPKMPKEKPTLMPSFDFNLTNKEVIVSISGGVDSMVSLYLAHKMGAKVTAVTINYKNRPEQDLEIEMVNEFCNLLGIPHHVREITEINRNRSEDRDIYEDTTREIRFGMYKKFPPLPVILGHNLDDSIENIFSNIKKQINYHNLFGMSEVSEEMGVTILRPLLKVAKKDIVKFAIDAGIPFTYDSTPDWSERGKMRDILVPFLNSFNDQIIPGLVNLAENFKQIHQVYNATIPKVEKDGNEIRFQSSEIFFFDYWKNILYQCKLGPISNKSIRNVITLLQKKKQCKVQLKIGVNIYRNNDSYLIRLEF
jgi:tRNA(Ile)-lysidine synthetase-like protein